MQKPNIFKIGSIVASLLIGVVALLIFSGKFPGVDINTSTNTNKATIQVWGTLPQKEVKDAFDQTVIASGKPMSVIYRYIPEGEITDEMLRASAQGFAPDMVLAKTDTLLSVSTLFYTIPYKDYMTELEYKTVYIDGTHQFATPFGALFYPVLADPIINIYNKKILSENGLLYPAKTWAELPKYQLATTKLGTDGKPSVSAFALGANNVLSNENLLFTILAQLGHTAVRAVWGAAVNGGITFDLVNDIGISSTDAGSADSDLVKVLKLFTAFSDPQKTSYTWSELATNDRDVFTSGSMAMIFAKASDLRAIQLKNNLLDIGLTYMPQMSNAKNIVTGGDVYAIAITKNTKDFPYVAGAAAQVAGKVFTSQLSNSLGMASARKDTLAGDNKTEYSEIVGQSAVLMKVIYDVHPKQTAALVYSLYDNILSGRKSIAEAADAFERAFDNLHTIIRQ
jgi:hypothetical protein